MAVPLRRGTPLVRPVPPGGGGGRPPDPPEPLVTGESGSTRRLRRIEVVDGTLLIGPGVAAGHQRAARRLARALESGCAAPLEIFSPFTLRLDGDTELVPDVAVVTVPDPLPRYPRDVRLVAEVLSPRSRRTDVALKGRVYADAGIPVFVVVDPDAVTIAVHELRGAEYEQVGAAARDGSVLLPDPVPVRLSPAALLRP